MRKAIIGVMGPGAGATKTDRQQAFKLGKLIAQNGWILLSGGRYNGVMDAVNKGAKSVGGLTIGILPTSDNTQTSDAVDVAILTGMGAARNNINVLSSDIVIACGMGTGTASEVALALKAGKHVVLLTNNQAAKNFFVDCAQDLVHCTNSPLKAIKICRTIINQRTKPTDKNPLLGLVTITGDLEKSDRAVRKLFAESLKRSIRQLAL